jgi:hypothetical protein
MADNQTKIVITAEDRASAALGRVAQSMGALVSSIGVGSALSVAGLTAMVKGTIDAADTMNDLSQRIGINVKSLAGWQLAANQSGTSIESVAKGVKGLSAYMVDHADKLKAAGITATDANGAMVQLADLFAAMPDGVEKTALAVQLFGKAGMDMIPMLNMGSAGLAEAQEKARIYGERLAELAPQADQFNDQMEELALHSKVAGINITSYFIPGLIGLSQWLNDVASGGKKAWNAIAWIVGGLPQGVTLGEHDAPKVKPPVMMLPGGNSPAEAEALRRAALLNPPAKKAGAGTKTDTGLARMLALGQRNLAGEADSEEEARILAEKRAMQESRTEFEALQRLLKLGEQNQLATYYEEASEETMRLVVAQQALKEAGTDTFADLTRAVEGWGNAFTDTLTDMVMGGKASFTDLANSIIRDMLRMQIKKSITEPLLDFGSDFLKGLLKPNAAGGVYASPDLHRYANTIVSSPTLFKFAQGGAFNGLMGEAGAEAIMPLARGANGKLGVQATGAGVVVNNNVSVVVNAEGGSSQGDSTQAAELGRRIEGAVRAVLMAEKRPRGLLGAS